MIFQDDFFDDVNKIIKNNKNKNEIKEMILNLTDNILGKLKKEVNNKSENDSTEKIEARQLKYDEVLSLITNNTKNIRKVKKFLKSIKSSIQNINSGIENISIEYQKQDWIEYILRVQFLKNFLPEVFVEIRKHIDIEGFIKEYDNYYMRYILNLDEVLISKTDLVILNELLYREDVIDYSRFMTNREKYLKELYSYDVKIQNINKYIEYFETYDDLIQIVKICENQGENYFEGREEFIKNLFKNLSKHSMVYNLDISELYILSTQIVEWLKRVHLSNEEKNIIQQYSNLIIRRVLVDNSHFLRNILLIFFNVTKVQNIWETLSVSNITEFYKVLKQIDVSFGNSNVNNEKDEFLHIKMYYKKRLEELHEDRYKSFDQFLLLIQ